MDTQRRWIRRPLAFAAAVMAAGLACGLFGEVEQNDGQVCSGNDECSTGVCTTASLCSHSACECPSGNCAAGGEQTSACLEGWVCVGYDSILAPIKEFFGGTPNPSDGYCMPSCAGGCPDHYVCNGELCSPDALWPYPEPTIAWTGDAVGEFGGRDQMTTIMVEAESTLTLTGSAISPVGAPIELSWTTVSAAADFMDFEGDTIETTVPTGSFRRVELFATDDEVRTGMVTVIFEACLGAGATCNFEGSGCCSGCDDATNTCE